jgi:hypothetical protein
LDGQNGSVSGSPRFRSDGARSPDRKYEWFAMD